MPYLLLIIGVLFGIYGLYRFFLNADVRQIKALLLAAVATAIGLALILMALTGQLGKALGLFIALLPFVVAYLRGRNQPDSPAAPSSSSAMTRSEALDVLGLSAEATEADIQLAYKKLMLKVHPDTEGSDWMAAKLNQARDILLK